ncbi:YckD family protein [Bacillus haynesii]|uniref:YckD family protein n=2 Tax=Bacillus haynesii TaxID=1925021 RepID=UPI00227F5AA8|nr:YckD family protein [Bacillus haynesii]MCY8352615.1 YckD family protein [Bacillus haynesii]
MMRKLCVCLILVIPLSCTALMSSAYGETRVYQELTDKQKNELASLQKDIMEKKKQLINKYVEYGILDQERGKEIKSHIEKRYEKERKNGFLPKWKHHKEKLQQHQIH